MFGFLVGKNASVLGGKLSAKENVSQCAFCLCHDVFSQVWVSFNMSFHFRGCQTRNEPQRKRDMKETNSGCVGGRE